MAKDSPSLNFTEKLFKVGYGAVGHIINEGETETGVVSEPLDLSNLISFTTNSMRAKKGLISLETHEAVKCKDVHDLYFTGEAFCIDSNRAEVFGNFDLS